MLIRPICTALIFKQIFFWNFLVVVRLERLICIKTIFYLAAIMKEVYRSFLFNPMWTTWTVTVFGHQVLCSSSINNSIFKPQCRDLHVCWWTELSYPRETCFLLCMLSSYYTSGLCVLKCFQWMKTIGEKGWQHLFLAANTKAVCISSYLSWRDVSILNYTIRGYLCV